jgi:hypothetical protein
VLVLDEADRILDMGFAATVDAILENLPREGRQTMLFSATQTKSVKVRTYVCLFKICVCDSVYACLCICVAFFGGLANQVCYGAHVRVCLRICLYKFVCELVCVCVCVCMLISM